jgi:hypothetical protein
VAFSFEAHSGRRLVPSWYQFLGTVRDSTGILEFRKPRSRSELKNSGFIRDREGNGISELKMQVSVVQFRPWAPANTNPHIE